jgi:hypothetical protein
MISNGAHSRHPRRCRAAFAARNRRIFRALPEFLKHSDDTRTRAVQSDILPIKNTFSSAAHLFALASYGLRNVISRMQPPFA